MQASSHEFTIAWACTATYSVLTQTPWALADARSQSREAVMWNKSQSEVPGTSTPLQETKAPGVPPSSSIPIRSVVPVARTLACLGSTFTIKGEISGDEDLQIDGKVEGPVSLHNHRLTVGRGAQLSSEIKAREVVVYGKAVGNIRVRDRVEIKRDGEVIGDITTARLSIEDGAYFKGSIEIDCSKSLAREEHAENAEVLAGISN
jgi:cytoskeletal protein CcmA (bactofilin family)